MIYNIIESEVREMAEISAKYKFVGMDDEGKTKNVNLPHAVTTADTTKMAALRSAYAAASDFSGGVIEIDHVKTEIIRVLAD